MEWHRVAAVAGASGIVLGAYGAHGLSKKAARDKLRWTTASEFQLLHALALATLPAFKKTLAREGTGVLLTAGMVLFSGSIYTIVLSGKKKLVSLLTPVGGVAMILGWASMALLEER